MSNDQNLGAKSSDGLSARDDSLNDGLKDGKETKFEQTAVAVFRVLNSKGNLKLNPSSVSRFAGVSRAWLYKYIGSSQSDLISFLLDYFGNDIGKPIQVDGTDERAWRIKFKKGTTKFLAEVRTYPFLIPFFIGRRYGDGIISEKLARIEEVYEREILKMSSVSLKMTEAENRKLSVILTYFRVAVGLIAIHPQYGKSFTDDELCRIVEAIIEEVFPQYFKKKTE